MKRTYQQVVSLLLALLLLAGAAQLPALADGESIVGEVTVITQTNANMRSGGSTDYPVTYIARSGDYFQTTGQVSTGWYEVLLPEGGFAYISDKLVYFYRYSVPVPLGNQYPQQGSQTAQYTVPVYYRTAQGATVKTVNVPVKVGQNIISADDTQVPGYRLISNRSVYVSVDASGRATPSGIVYTYEPYYGTATAAPEVAATVPVYYKDSYNRIVASEYRALKPGSHLLRADTSKLPAGWYISGNTDAVVFVSTFGTASPAEVNFSVTGGYTQPQQATYTVPVSYRDETGSVLFNTTQTVQPGYTTVTANSALVPAGYTLTSVGSVVVYTSSQGYSIPSTVIFSYRRDVMATISVVYQDLSGRALFYGTEQKAPGTHTIRANSANVPSGYVLQGSGSAQVTVYQNGVAAPNQVIFTYSLPMNAQLPIIYRDSAGRQLYSETRTLKPGTYTITADDSLVSNQYILQNTRNVRVTVNNSGVANPERVVYIYDRPLSANVTITYKDEFGGTLASETRTLQQGTHTVHANSGLVPGGYVLYSGDSVEVTVDNKGVARPESIRFTYGPPRAPVTVNVPVYYKDQSGNVLYSAGVAVTSDKPRVLTANKDRVPAGYTLISESRLTLTVSPAGVPNPREAVFVYRAPGAAAPAGDMSKYITFSFSGSAQPVYTGPGTNYYRAGRASVAGGRLRLWGTEGDWALIGYGLTNNLYRVGYIKKSALPKSVNAPVLNLGSETVKILKESPVYDDPIIKPLELFKLKAGTQVTLLGYLNNYYAYIEGRYSNKPFRGFVNMKNVSKP